jgi:hypothetical protein
LAAVRQPGSKAEKAGKPRFDKAGAGLFEPSQPGIVDPKTRAAAGRALGSKCAAGKVHG